MCGMQTKEECEMERKGSGSGREGDPMSEDRYECVCRPEHILLYIVMSYSLVKREVMLHAIDRSKRTAQRHKQALDHQYKEKDIRARVTIEEVGSDHLFATSMGFAI